MFAQYCHSCFDAKQGAGIAVFTSNLWGKMKIGIITYGSLESLDSEIRKIKRRFPQATLSVINNKPGAAKADQIQGSNGDYEFGGYSEMVELWSAEAQHGTTTSGSDGPFLIVNDTLFQTHYTEGWLDLVSLSLNSMNASGSEVYGDIRRDGDSLAERPDPFLASWFFLLPNRTSLQRFSFALNQSLQEPQTEFSEGYRLFLENWLHPKGKWRGWQGSAHPSVKERKIRCIYLEHRLSKLMPLHQLQIVSMGYFGENRYKVLRLIDRIRTRIKAWLG
jgi:hypothetical protein